MMKLFLIILAGLLLVMSAYAQDDQTYRHRADKWAPEYHKATLMAVRMAQLNKTMSAPDCITFAIRTTCNQNKECINKLSDMMNVTPQYCGTLGKLADMSQAIIRRPRFSSRSAIQLGIGVGIGIGRQ
jgi:hypothetical protein